MTNLDRLVVQVIVKMNKIVRNYLYGVKFSKIELVPNPPRFNWSRGMAKLSDDDKSIFT